MIVPMKKISLVVLDKEKDSALKSLRKLGVVHIEQTGIGSENLSQLKQKADTFSSALSILSEYKTPDTLSDSGNIDGYALAAEAVHIFENKKMHSAEAAETEKTLEQYVQWGDIDPATVAELAHKGIFISAYTIPAKDYSAIGDDVKTVVLVNDRKTVRFVVIQDTDAMPDLPETAVALELPTQSTEQMRASIAVSHQAEACMTARLQEIAAFYNCIVAAKKENDSDIEFETARAGMIVDTETSAALAALQGYVPVGDFAAISAAAKENGWALAQREPREEDNVPTKVKNNKLVSLIYPVSDFLGTVPGYREYDISGWFLLFFCIFFGMIFGDGGYGLLLTLVGLVMCIKSGSASPAPRLLVLLGLSTSLWGVLTCTWFGIPPESLPQFIRSISFAPISNVTSAQSPEMEALVKQNLQIFCFMLALVQLSVAHLKGVVRYCKSARFLGEIGSLLMLWGMFAIVLNMVVSSERFPIPQVAIILVGAGFVLNFVFSNYAGSLGASILESCKNIVSVLLGVVNVFSDIVSYIRLWAVGMAGAAISATVNQMAGPTLGSFLVFAGILLLVFGHGLNMILNVLSVIVHGVRLNTLEFSNHLGMTWSGFKYAPFSESAKK